MSDSESESEVYEPSLEHLIKDSTIQWVFVGGKGGVGKTTTSCSLALRFAKERPNAKVLIISTDPAHNLSDAFQQKITDEPTNIQGIDNLFAMETDPEAAAEKMGENGTDLPSDGSSAGAENPLAKLKDIAKNLPGIDEAMSFNHLMTQVKKMEYEVVVFDTAPTGHTLRLLALPQTLGEGMSSLMDQGGMMGTLMQTMQSAMGGGGDPRAQLDAMSAQVQEIGDIFRDADKTTFVCVCIPEFLSVFETERLIQELSKFEIDVSNVVVNQVLAPEKDSKCNLCAARSKMQAKYLGQIDELYEDYHVVKMPLLHNEVRGVAALEHFSNNLISPFDFAQS